MIVNQPPRGWKHSTGMRDEAMWFENLLLEAELPYRDWQDCDDVGNVKVWHFRLWGEGEVQDDG